MMMLRRWVVLVKVVSVSTPDLFAHNFGAWFGGESD
jgi:hypothetical protein